MPPRLGCLGLPRSITLRFAFALVSGSMLCGPPARAQLAWSIQNADPNQNAGWSTSLRLNSDGLPRVAEWVPGVGVRYASYDGSSWSLEVPSSPAAIATRAGEARLDPAHTDLLITTATALALDPSGDPWLVSAVTDQLHYDPPPIAVSVGHRTGGVWTLESIDPGLNLPSVDVDASGRPHVCFDAGTPQAFTLEYEVRDAGVWTGETVDANGSSGILRIDAQGVPHIAYWDRARGVVVHAFRAGPGAWDTTTVPAPAVGPGFGFALSPVGLPRVVMATGNGNPPLRYFEQQPDGSWTTEVADNAPGTKGGLSLALDPAGDPVIAYGDTGVPGLKIAFRKGGVWTTQAVDASGNTGYYPSVAVDGHARSVVSYQSHALPLAGLLVAFGASTVGVSPEASPRTLRLVALRPNPARAGAPLSLTLTMPADAPVSLEAFDASGRRVATRTPQVLAAGVATITWDAALDRPGLYFVRASTGAWHATTKLAVTR